MFIYFLFGLVTERGGIPENLAHRLLPVVLYSFWTLDASAASYSGLAPPLLRLERSPPPFPPGLATSLFLLASLLSLCLEGRG